MRVLFTGLLAATVVGCTTLPHADKRPTELKVGVEFSKSIKSRKTKTVTARAFQPRRADPVTEKAKTAIAARLEDPASAEFYNLQRARKNLLHTTMDTVCGYVKAKDGPGGDIREMPFLYTVDDGEAYLVNGRSQVSATVHGALCK